MTTKKALKELSAFVKKQLSSNIETNSFEFKIKNIDGSNTAKVSEQSIKLLKKQRPFSKIAFVDGGTCLFANTPTFAIGLNRTAHLIYDLAATEKKSQRFSRKEDYVAAYLDNDENMNIRVVIEEILGKNIIKMPSNIPMLNDNNTLKLGRAVDYSRRLMEINACNELMQELSEGDVIILDGSLACQTEGEEKEIDNLLKKGLSKNILVIGFSKTSSMITSNGKSVSSECRKISKNYEQWYIQPKIEGKLLPIFAKLHKKSDYVFRIDFPNEITLDKNKIIGYLAYLSTDLSFPGYPNGLVAVDRIARVTNEEKEYMQIMLEGLLGKEYKQLQSEERTITSHSKLDSMF